MTLAFAQVQSRALVPAAAMFEACAAAGQALIEPSSGVRVGLTTITVPTPLVLPGELAGYNYLVTCTVRTTDRGSEIVLASSKATPAQATHLKASFTRTADQPEQSSYTASPPLERGAIVNSLQRAEPASACGRISLRHHPDTGYDLHPAVLDASLHLSACGDAAPTLLRVPAAAGFYGRARRRGAETAAWPASLQEKAASGSLVAGFTMTSDTEPAGSVPAFILAHLQLRAPGTPAAPTHEASRGRGSQPGLPGYVIEWQASSAGLRVVPQTIASCRPVLEVSNISVLPGRLALNGKSDLPGQVAHGCARALRCLQQLSPGGTFASTFESGCVAAVTPGTANTRAGSVLAAAVAAMLRVHSAETVDRAPLACTTTSPLDEYARIQVASRDPASGISNYRSNAQGVRFLPILKPAVRKRTWLDSATSSGFEGEAAATRLPWGSLAVTHVDK